MRIEFFPKVTRLLENEPGEITMRYLEYRWPMPTITVRPPYYTKPQYEPYYPLV